MFALIVGAVRSRAAQALTLTILTALAGAAAAAGPWSALAAAGRTAGADIAATPASARVISVSHLAATTSGDPAGELRRFAATAADAVPVAGAVPVLGAVQEMKTRVGVDDQYAPVAYRDGFCAHVTLTGACPAAPGEVAVSAATARRLDAGPGDRITVRAAADAPPLRLTVVGTYDLSGVDEAYWSSRRFRASTGLDPMFTPLTTFAERELSRPTLVYDAEVPEAVLRGGDGPRVRETVAAAAPGLERAQYKIDDPTGELVSIIARDRSAIVEGVLVALGQVLVLGWAAIGLAGRATGRDRRGDAALLKLRGSSRTATLRLTFGQHLVPMLAGALAGLPAGLLIARWMTGPVTPAERPLALGLSAAAAGLVLLGGLAVMAAVEAAVLRLPVADLLRRLPPRRRDWRSDLVDVPLLAVAAAAVYQARSGGPDTGIALVAPALAALAVGLLLARLLAPVADRAGAAALAGGRLRWGLTAVQFSRRSGTDRVFALVVVAVAMFVTAAGGFAAGREERVDRAEVELGAERVLTVRADNRTALLSAVRRADPTGRWAMAAVVDRAPDLPVIAVDSSRLAAVTHWRGEYGDIATLPAAVAGAPGPRPLPLITGTRLTLSAVNHRAAPVTVAAVVQNATTGETTSVPLGPITGERTVSAPVQGCTPATGCRLVRWELLTPAAAGGGPKPAPKGSAVTIRALAQDGPAATLLDAGTLGDIGRWRPGPGGAPVDVTTRDGGLRLTMDANPEGFTSPGHVVAVVDGPVPVPAVLAGPPPEAWQLDDPTATAFDGDTLRVHVAGTAAVLPVLGGRGLLLDLDGTRRVSADTGLGGTGQVWLAADAPAAVVPALTAAGLTVLDDDAVPRRAARLAEQAPAVVSRFVLLAAGFALLLAAAVVAVAAAVDRRALLDQLTALRLQGLSHPAAVCSGWAGLAAVPAAGLIGGLVAATVAVRLTGITAPPFSDGWTVIARPGVLGAVAVTAAGLVSATVFGLTGWWSVTPLVRALRRRRR